MEEKNNKPVNKFRAGALTVTVWENKSVNKESGDQMTFSSVNLSRSYKDGEEWKQTQSLRVSDLPKAILLLNKAFESLVIKQNSEEEKDN